MKTKPLEGQTYTVLEGPAYHPNGRVKVKVIRADVLRSSDVPIFYVCSIIEGSRAGKILRVHHSAFEDVP